MTETGTKKISEKVIKDELENGMPNLSEEKETVQDELHPITFVAVSPVLVKSENLHDQQSASCDRDPLLPAPCEEYSCNGDMTKIKNVVKEEKEYVPDLKIKLEAGEDMSFDNTISSKYSEDVFIDRIEEVEIKFESIFDISEEKPIKTCLDIEKYENDKNELLSFKEKSDILNCEAKESSCFGYQQEMNLELGFKDVNYLEEKDAIVMEIIRTPDEVVESGNSNLAIDETSKLERRGKKNRSVLKKHSGNDQNSYICLHCEAVFSSKLMYEQHLSCQSEKSVHVYPSEFTSKKELEEFQRSSCSAMKNYSCNLPVNSSEQVERCCGTHTPERAFSCCIHKKSCSEKKILDTHLQTRNGEKLFNFCGECEKSSALKCSLHKHKQSSTAEEPVSCAVSEKSISGQYDLNVHMQFHAGRKLFSCGFCEKQFSFQSELDKHIRIHAGEKPFLCSICNKSFAFKARLNQHMRIHIGEKPFPCGFCEKSFGEKAALNVHMRTHTGDRPFSCEICTKSFFTKATLISHKFIHTGQRSFTCDVCNKSFLGNKSLNVHMQFHAGENLLKCGICKKSFGHYSVLKRHMKTHSVEKPYECDICKKSFALKCVLKKHIRIHTGKKEFSCDICKKTLSTKFSLKIHKRTHTGEKPYSCGLCKKTFSRKSYLTSHKRVHTGEKAFECGVCGKSYSYKSKLIVHLQTHSGQ